MLRTRTGAIVVSALLVLGTAIVSVAVIVAAHAGDAPHFGSPAATARSTGRTNRLVIAGSGSNVPITRRLAAAFRLRNADITVVVHDSIGSTGGVRAVSDGAVDLGLMSRPLRDAEGTSLSTTTYARVGVVVAAHPEVQLGGFTAQQLVAIYTREKTRWPTNDKIVALQRERGDSGQRAVAVALPEFGRANEAAWRRGLFRVVYSDRAMEAALLATSGAIGISDAGVIKVQRLPLRVFALAGVVKELSFVWRDPLSHAAQSFVGFVRSAEGQRILRDGGYEPVGASK